MRHSTPFFPSLHSRLAPLGLRSIPLLRQIRQRTLSQIEQSFRAALPDFLFPKNRSGDHSRERVFTLTRTLWCWIWQVLQANTSCREVVRQVQALFALHEAGEVDEATGAYCQARRKLPEGLLKNLFDASFQSAERAAPTPAKALLQNRPVRVVDASGARLADTPKNRAAYPPSDNLAAGAGFPFLRIVVLFSLASGALLAQASGSLRCSEQRLWHNLLSCLHRADILLGDRAYGHYVVAALLQSVGVDLMATVAARARKVDFRKAKKRLGPQDSLFVWKKPAKPSSWLSPQKWRALPPEITVRLLRVTLERRGFRTEHLVLVTTLLDPELYPACEILATHARRWRLEMCLDDLKTTLGMESLRCHCPEMVEKELLVFLIAHNLVRWLMTQAASNGSVELDGLSFKGSLDAFRQWSQALAQHGSGHRHRQRRDRLWSRLLEILVADAVPYRPGRHEPRAVKKRSKYPHLNQSRHQYRGRWSRGKRRRIAIARKRASLN
jgi:DDE family transposase